MDGGRSRAVVPHGRTHARNRSGGKRRPRLGDVEIRSYLRDQAESRSLVFDLSIAHDRFGSSSHVQQIGQLTHPQDLDGPMRAMSWNA